MAFFICPNCKERSIDDDGREGLTSRTLGCRSCGFGFLFELMDDYYPGPNTGFVVCDQQALEWGVRRLGERLELTSRSGLRKRVVADFFPAYDADGGLLVALSPA